MVAAIPPHITAELKAAAKESGLAFDDALLFNTMFDVEHGGKRLGGCSTMAATGAASASGEPIMGRNFDLPQPFWGLSPLGIVVVRHPDKKTAWAAVTHSNRLRRVTYTRASVRTMASLISQAWWASIVIVKAV